MKAGKNKKGKNKKGKNFTGRYLAASFTIEASVIVPIIIFALVAFIWVIFYLRNSIKCTALSDMFVFILEKDAARRGYEGSFDGSLSDTDNGFYGMKESKAECLRNGRDISVKFSLTHKIPEEGLLGKMVSGIRTISVEKEERIPVPSENARIIKAAGEILGNIKQALKKKE